MGTIKKKKKPKVENTVKVKRKPIRKKRINKVIAVDTKRFKRGALKGLWLRCYLDDENKRTFLQGTESAIFAGYNCKTRASFSAIARRNKVKFEKDIVKYLDENHLSVAVLKRKMIYLLDAKKDMFFAHQGKVVSKRKVAALDIQQRTLDMAMKARGMGAYSADGVINEPLDVRISYTEPVKRAPELEPDYETMSPEEQKVLYNEKMRELELFKERLINNKGLAGQEPDEYGYFR